MIKRILPLLFLLTVILPFSVRAEELTAPPLQGEAAQWMPEQHTSFADSLMNIVQKAVPAMYAELHATVRTGLAVFACVLLVSVLRAASDGHSPAEMAGGICIASLLICNSRTMIGLTVKTVTEISEYSKLFLPVLTAAASAQGAVTSSTALFVGTSVFTSFLSNVLQRIMLPAIYLFLAAAVAGCALGESSFKNIKEQFKKLSAWFLKTLVTVFLSYMSITGAVTGTTDKAAVKAAKTAISMAVPVIGGTLAEASETLLISAGLVKNAIGIYGIFAFLAIFLSPFFRISAQYLMLKATASVCSAADCKRLTDLIADFCTTMGLLLAMTGTMCLLSIIGTVCFMKGAG